MTLKVLLGYTKCNGKFLEIETLCVFRVTLAKQCCLLSLRVSDTGTNWFRPAPTYSCRPTPLGGRYRPVISLCRLVDVSVPVEPVSFWPLKNRYLRVVSEKF